MRMRKLSEHVEIERGLRAIYGKSKGTLVSNTTLGPAPYDAIPDYGDIYYQPDDDPRREDESEMRMARREATAVANRGKYGFHGTADADDTPILRYESEDFPQNAPRRNPSPNERRAAVVTPNKYPQPVKTGPVKHVVQREKMFGKVGTGAQVQGAGSGRRPKGGTGAGEGVRFSETNEAQHSHKPKPQASPNAPSVTKPKMIGDGGSEQPTVRNERAVRYVASAKRPGVAQRMGR